jgi:EAL domain-containing protein (putative c-di-GMP-specific phosphodiesterase class I)
VDRSFIEQLRRSEQDALLVSTFLATARGMRLLTVAEGVEDSHQARWLHEAGCDLGQGFLWSRPVDLASARDLPKSLSRHVIDSGVSAGV